ncbi:MAG: DNA-binding protein WhiA [Eubacterium sp.]|nr:DNA-binding protein WhiA [Eubacterium sp.]
MSFSSDVKEELSRVTDSEQHCRIAELSAIISLCGLVRKHAGGYGIRLQTENVPVARRFYKLLKETFFLQPEVSVRRHDYLKKNRYYTITVRDSRAGMKILKSTGILNNLGYIDEDRDILDNPVLQRTCCRRAFLRGAFLSAGSMTDPEKNYHFEVVCSSFEKASWVRDLFNSFDLEAKIVERKKYYVVYMKEGSMISDALNVMGAHVALMKFENVRILKEVRNEVNRRVNCEAANINKTVSAARKQIEDIRYIDRTVGLDSLPLSLRDVAYARLEEPEISLKELGAGLRVPVGKSGVNHRLRKLSQIAQEIRDKGRYK